MVVVWCKRSTVSASYNYTKQARNAQILYHEFAATYTSHFKSLFRMFFLKNCAVQDKDVKLAQRAFALDAPTLKGKSTRP